MDDSVNNFFTKNAKDNYAEQYENDHGPRLSWLLKEFNVNPTGQKIVDVGGGLGFLGKRLDKSNEYWVIDGADIPAGKQLCNGDWHKADLDYEKFAEEETIRCDSKGDEVREKLYPKFDMGFCLETLEHLTNPYNCLVEMKKLVKTNGEIYISIPHINVWHNYIYPALMFNEQNFTQFLGQMALPVIEYKLWDKGWNAHTFRCRNAPWTDSVMLFKKDEPKFYGKTPVEYVNL